jgi:hypothetical protein
MNDSTTDNKIDTSLRQVRHFNLGSVKEDVFMRYWVMLLNKGEPVRSLNNPGHAARLFVDTVANLITISGKFHQYLMDNWLKDTLIPGPSQGLTVTLAAGNKMRVSGDEACILVEVKLTTHKVVEEQDFLILDEDSEDLVMGVEWYLKLLDCLG